MFDELERAIQQLLAQLNAEQQLFNGQYLRRLHVLLPEPFLRRYTVFASFDELRTTAEAQNFGCLTGCGWTLLRGAAWDGFVAAHSQFATWPELLYAAAAASVAREVSGL